MSGAADDDPDQERLAFGMAVAGCAFAVVGIVIFFVPFLDLMFCLIGMAFGGRGMALYAALARRDDTAKAKAGGSGWPLALAGLVLGLIGLVPACLVTYSAAYRS